LLCVIEYFEVVLCTESRNVLFLATEETFRI